MRQVLKGLFLSCMLAFIAACGSRKMATKGVKPVKGEVEIAIPCAEVRTDKEHFRTSQSASSQDMAMARDKAILNAKSRLAALIQTRLKSVFSGYRNERGLGTDKEYEEKYEQEARDVTNQILSDVRIICEKVTKSPDGRFNTYVGIEMAKSSAFEAAQNALTKDQKLRIDYDQKKFREVFDKEMAQLAGAQ